MSKNINNGMVDPRELSPSKNESPYEPGGPEIDLDAGKREKNISTVDPKREVEDPSREGESKEERLPGKDETI